MTWNEALRKLAHLAAFWPALLLPWLTPGQALMIAFSLVLMNMFLLPRFAKSLYRSQEPGMGALEIVLYPFAVMACIVAYGWKPTWYLPVMAAWFGLACVDSFIGIGCRLFPKGPTLPWNSRKSIFGFAVGALTAAFPACLLASFLSSTSAGTSAFCSDGIAWIFGLVMLAALAETVWFGIADNLIIPFTLCIAIPLVPSPLFDTTLSSLSFEALQNIFKNGIGSFIPILIPFGFAVAAYATGLLTLGGSILGGSIALILCLANPWLLAFLGGFFLLGNVATRYGFKSKLSRGIAEGRGGKRGAAEVFGAMGLAGWMTPLVYLTQVESDGLAEKALLVCIAPLIAKTMDTVSSEIGKTIAGKTVSLKTFQGVPPGTDGAVSLGGTLWGLAAAMALAIPVVVLGWGSWNEVFVLLAIAILANIFEAFWSEWVTRGELAGAKGMSQGAHTNVLMTLVSAVLAWVWWFGLG